MLFTNRRMVEKLNSSPLVTRDILSLATKEDNAKSIMFETVEAIDFDAEIIALKLPKECGTDPDSLLLERSMI